MRRLTYRQATRRKFTVGIFAVMLAATAATGALVASNAATVTNFKGHCKDASHLATKVAPATAQLLDASQVEVRLLQATDSLQCVNAPTYRGPIYTFFINGKEGLHLESGGATKIKDEFTALAGHAVEIDHTVTHSFTAYRDFNDAARAKVVTGLTGSTGTTTTTGPATTTTTQPSTGGLSCTNPQRLDFPKDEFGTIHFPGNLTVQADVWSPGRKTGNTKQTMDVCSPSSWRATVTATGQPEDGVTTYPDSGTTYPDGCAQTHKLSDFASTSSTYAFVPPTANASWDAAYDIFLGGQCPGEPFTEVMVWNQWNNVSVPNAQIHPTIDGVAYDIFHSGGYIQVRRHVQNSSGSVNLLAILSYLQSQSLITDVHRVFVQYGIEVLTTYSKPVPFLLTGFTVTDTLK